MKKDTVFIVAFLLVLLTAFVSFTGQNKRTQPLRTVSPLFSEEGEGTIFISVKDTELRALIADSLKERIRGLSGRASLPEDTGMLFIFPGNTEAGIWMKDMLFPIDIMWIDEDLRIIHIVEGASPDSYPEVFKPDTPTTRYVLETNVGFVSDNDIALGDPISL